MALDSRAVRRLWMDLKKDSWVAGGVDVAWEAVADGVVDVDMLGEEFVVVPGLGADDDELCMALLKDDAVDEPVEFNVVVLRSTTEMDIDLEVDDD